MEENLLIGLDGLKAPGSHFDWHADGKFFGEFENSEILDADLDTATEVTPSGSCYLIDCAVKGSVTVLCDRCLSEVVLPVERLIRLSVRYGQGPSGMEEEGRELIFLPDAESVLDLGQILYDYVCTALPLVRVHPDGGCDPDVVKFLGRSEEPAAEESQNPFASLKTLLDEK